jgi:hypothetical protein
MGHPRAARMSELSDILSVATEKRAEAAGGESFEGVEASGELTAGQAALAVQPAQEVGGRTVRFAGVAFQAAGDHVAIGIASEMRLRDDMIEALQASAEAP